MLLRKLVVVGLAGLFSLAASIATAEDADGPSSAFVGADGVSFDDPNDPLQNRFDLSFGEAAKPRFTNSSSFARAESDEGRYRRYELAFSTHAAGLDVAFSQRAGVGFNEHGDIERESRTSELRLGRGLRNLRRDSSDTGPSWYFFAASEDEALTWRPGARNAFGGAQTGFALQDHVEIGDMQAGLAYEANGWQASLAYVQREVSVRTGSRTVSEDEDFAGFTLTMRR